MSVGKKKVWIVRGLIRRRKKRKGIFSLRTRRLSSGIFTVSQKRIRFFHEHGAEIIERTSPRTADFQGKYIPPVSPSFRFTFDAHAFLFRAEIPCTPRAFVYVCIAMHIFAMQPRIPESRWREKERRKRHASDFPSITFRVERNGEMKNEIAIRNLVTRFVSISFTFVQYFTRSFSGVTMEHKRDITLSVL